MNLKTVKDLIGLVAGTDIVELEWSPEKIRIIRCKASGQEKIIREPMNMPKAVNPDKPTVTITSPLVGTFYRSASPETQPFVQVGDRVTKDQCLCVIEAMKLMNEIESHLDGIVAAILKQDGERVGYGDPLFIIEEL